MTMYSRKAFPLARIRSDQTRIGSDRVGSPPTLSTLTTALSQRGLRFFIFQGVITLSGVTGFQLADDGSCGMREIRASQARNGRENGSKLSKKIAKTNDLRVLATPISRRLMPFSSPRASVSQQFVQLSSFPPLPFFRICQRTVTIYYTLSCFGANARYLKCLHSRQNMIHMEYVRDIA